MYLVLMVLGKKESEGYYYFNSMNSFQKVVGINAST
jgi:hypothetical protein